MCYDRRMSVNQEVARRLERLAQLMELLGHDRFRVVAHERAARAVESLTVDVAGLAGDKKKLTEIEGIGAKIADKIVEFCETGKIAELEKLQGEVPAGVVRLLDIPNLGPKTAAVLWKEGGVTDIASLKKVIEDGSILKLPRMGTKSVERLKESLALADEAGARLPLGLALPVAETIVAAMEKVKGVTLAAYAGSLRRGRDTIGDIDVLITARDGESAAAAFRGLPGVRRVLAAGKTKSSVRYGVDAELGRWARREGEEGEGPTVQVDLRVVPEASWGAALMYFTGSKEHNVRLRERALKKKLTLNEYGLFPLDEADEPPQSRGVKPVASRSEEEIYGKLGLPFIPPELREDRSELELTETPALIELEDIGAELHAHTTASDGLMSIEELAETAKRRGYHTIAVTDHSRSSAIAGGLSEDDLLEHAAAVRAVDSKIKGIKVLAGSEVDIHADGSLDYPDRVLAELDIVIASPHAALSQDGSAATKRLLAAISNPHVHILGHPTGRLINRRAGMNPDMGKVIEAARERGVALEINAHWLRLDLRDVHVRAAVEGGCLLAINCDVHGERDFENLRFGVATARRGWLTAERCVNAWTSRKLGQWLKSRS